MQTDGRTDMTKLIVAFHNFEKAPKEKKAFAFKLYKAQRLPQYQMALIITNFVEFSE
jgi:hypothetical protein